MNKQYQIEESRLLERLSHLEQQARNEYANYHVNESLMQREVINKEENAYKESLRANFEAEQKRIRLEADAHIASSENKMQLDFEKYASRFSIMQAEMDNRFAHQFELMQRKNGCYSQI